MNNSSNTVQVNARTLKRLLSKIEECDNAIYEFRASMKNKSPIAGVTCPVIKNSMYYAVIQTRQNFIDQLKEVCPNFIDIEI